MPLATLTSRVDSRDKSTFTALCDSIGITTSAAVNMFVKAAVRENRIPFELKGDPVGNPVADQQTNPANQSNQLNGFNGLNNFNSLNSILNSLNRETIETIEAMLEAERIARDPNAKSYTVEEAFAELDKD